MDFNLTTVLLVLGLVIAVIDIFTTGYIFPFAMAIFFTGVISYWVKNINILLIVFSIQVIIYYYIFFKFIRKYKAKIDEDKIGYVKRKQDGFYIVDFPTGFKGEVQWKAISDNNLDIGDKVKVKKIDGNILIVEKV